LAVSDDFVLACELHDSERLAAALDAGLDPNTPFSGKTALTWLLEMYTRSDRFPACVRVLLDRGARLPDATLAPVLLNDGDGIRRANTAEAPLARRRVSLPCAFTPLDDATLLHVAAEFGHLDAARALLAIGADVNAPAGVDVHGHGGHTPLFHTVNSHANRSAPVMRALLDAGADPTVRVHGLTWGRAFEWETTFFDLTPIAYAQLGTLPQMHRDEQDIAKNVHELLVAAGRPVPPMPNVPNRYASGRGSR
jgi:Ankyrin repeats (3 copies)